MLILATEDLRRAAPMGRAMEAVADAFAQLAAGEAKVPLRQHVPLGARGELALVMPALLARSGAFGVKALTLYPENVARSGLPAIAALVLLFETATGQPLALVSGAALTALRTGAASGVATQLMARPDARTLALFGAGTQALAQAHAVCVARPIERIWVANRTRERAERLAAVLGGFGPPVPADVRVAASSREALAEADVVCAATASPAPVFDDTDVRAGTHINAIGAYRPDMREIPGPTVARARVVVDARDAAWAEAGDLIQARDEGLIGEGHVAAALGEVVLGRILGRSDPGEITLFKSVGSAVQDVAVAHMAYARARELGIGTDVAL